MSFCQFYFQCLQDYWLYWSVESHCDYVFQWPVYQHFSKLVGAMWTKMLAKLKEYFLGWLRNCVISSAINWLIRSKLLLWGCNIWNFIQKYFFLREIGPVSPKYVWSTCLYRYWHCSMKWVCDCELSTTMAFFDEISPS